MRRLAIDTASDRLAVAFRVGDQAPHVRSPDPRGAHTQLLVPTIDELLAGTAPPEEVVVVTGPGSYAGLRVGIATAEALALGWGIPVRGVSTLEAVVTAALERGAALPIVAIHPAGRREFAVQRFAAEEAQEPIRLVPYARLGELREPLAGEGAGELGGLEVLPAERAVAALRRAARGLAGSTSAVYLREPHVTLTRARWWRERHGSRAPRTTEEDES